MNRTSLKHGITPTPVEVTCVFSAKSQIGEGPWWSAAEQRLYWVDILGKQVHVFDPAAGTNQTHVLPEIVTSVAPRRKGGLILTLRNHIAFFDPKTGELERVAEPEPELPGNRFNDGKCDRQGRLWAGTMGDIEWDQPVGNLYRFGADRKAVRMEEKICCSNGLGWSPDNTRMYYVDSVPRTLNLAGRVITPGLVNVHTHAILSMVRGVAEDMGFAPAYTPGIPHGHDVTPEEARALSRLGAVEGHRNSSGVAGRGAAGGQVATG